MAIYEEDYPENTDWLFKFERRFLRGMSGNIYEKMDFAPALVKWAWKSLKHWVWTLVDAIPPYQRVEGLLETKETDSRGRKHYIWVASAKMEVDRNTFETLIVGENLRVLYTRGNRAINIDRLLPGRGPG